MLSENARRGEGGPPARMTLAEFRRRLASLGPRQRRVARLVIEGEPNKRIAEALGVSPRTTDRLRAEVFAALGARSTAELARWLGFAEATEFIAAAIRDLLADGDGASQEQLRRFLGALQSGALLLPPFARDGLSRLAAEHRRQSAATTADVSSIRRMDAAAALRSHHAFGRRSSSEAIASAENA